MIYEETVEFTEESRGTMHTRVDFNTLQEGDVIVRDIYTYSGYRKSLVRVDRVTKTQAVIEGSRISKKTGRLVGCPVGSYHPTRYYLKTPKILDEMRKVKLWESLKDFEYGRVAALSPEDLDHLERILS